MDFIGQTSSHMQHIKSIFFISFVIKTHRTPFKYGDPTRGAGKNIYVAKWDWLQKKEGLIKFDLNIET
jgi:hypothetical protein